MVPYADFNLLKFPDKEKAMEKIADLTLLSDIFPTGFHGAVMAKVGLSFGLCGLWPVWPLACAASGLYGLWPVWPAADGLWPVFGLLRCWPLWPTASVTCAWPLAQCLLTPGP